LAGSRPDIPLREPIDNDFKLNRKIAKKIYNDERLEKVKELKDLEVRQRE
jgi:hypothetical protein